jgi:hypothetical protein
MTTVVDKEPNLIPTELPIRGKQEPFKYEQEPNLHPKALPTTPVKHLTRF